MKRLTRRIVAPLLEGSIPSSHPIIIRFLSLGRSQVGKARDFDSRMRWFESSRPSQCDPLAQSVVHAFLKGHYRGHYTIEELSVRFKMSPTVLKKCFKGVYGNSVYAYMKKYRLQMAERLLKENKLTIGEIALQIGYQNPNKFTSAFRTEYGMTPTEYRKKKTQESLNG